MEKNIKLESMWISPYRCFAVRLAIAKKKKQSMAFRQKLITLGLVKSYEYLEVFENNIFLDLIKITDKYLKSYV